MQSTPGIYANSVQRTTLVECAVSEEEQAEMRKQAEMRQQTEMKKEAAMKKKVQVEIQKQTESKRAQVDAMKAEKAERRRIALAQKKASDQLQAQQSKTAAQPPDLGYDHTLFGEVSDLFRHVATSIRHSTHSPPSECF